LRGSGRRSRGWRRGTSLSATAFIAVLILVLSFAVPLAGQVHKPEKVARIGYLLLGSPRGDAFVEAFKQGLRELGYVEGRNISIEYRAAEGRDERLPRLAAELVRLKVDVIVAPSRAAVAAQQATTTIPIVMPIITDPVRLGLVASLARPGGNVTGLATQNNELPGKWLELVKEALPSVSRVAVLLDPAYDGGVQLRASEAAARSLGVHLQTLAVGRPEDLSTALTDVLRKRAGALIVSSSPLFYVQRRHVVEFVAKHRLPTIYHSREFVAASGGLMSYGPDFHDLFRRSATYVDKILRGAKPSDLPVEQPTKFELVINMKTAKGLGLTVPPSLVARADQVIE
jgi:ABC-type uncharacterized transport system substrate-binding protein